jgi:hypothetical protein
MGRGNSTKKINPKRRGRKEPTASENALELERLNRRIRNLSLPSLQDVDSSLSPTDGQVIIYDQASQKWIAADLPSGGGGTGVDDKHYIHNQSTASATWSVTHNLSKKPSVSVVDTSGNVIEGSIKYTNLNSLIIKFNASFSGEAYLN